MTGALAVFVCSVLLKERSLTTKNVYSRLDTFSGLGLLFLDRFMGTTRPFPNPPTVSLENNLQKTDDVHSPPTSCT